MKRGAGHVTLAAEHSGQTEDPEAEPVAGPRSATSPASVRQDRPRTFRRQGLKKYALPGLVLYVAALHLACVFLVFKTNFIDLSLRTLGWSPPPSESIFALDEWIVDQAERDRGVPDGSVLLLGDSIIAQLDPLSIGPQIVNFGLAGDTTRTMLRRLPTLRALDRAQAAVIGVGSNDLRYRGPAETAALYARVLDRLPEALEVLIVSVLPVNENAREARQRHYPANPDIRLLNDALRRLCAARPRCRYLDAWPEMFDATSGGLRPEMDRGDGLHLSAMGARVLGGLIAGALVPLGAEGRAAARLATP